MQKSPSNPSVLLWGLCVSGDIVASLCADVAEAERYGRLNIESGAWRTWDVFEPPVEVRKGWILASSHGKPGKPPARRVRARIIPE